MYVVIHNSLWQVSTSTSWIRLDRSLFRRPGRHHHSVRLHFELLRTPQVRASSTLIRTQSYADIPAPTPLDALSPLLPTPHATFRFHARHAPGCCCTGLDDDDDESSESSDDMLELQSSVASSDSSDGELESIAALRSAMAGRARLQPCRRRPPPAARRRRPARRRSIPTTTTRRTRRWTQSCARAARV